MRWLYDAIYRDIRCWFVTRPKAFYVTGVGVVPGYLSSGPCWWDFDTVDVEVVRFDE